MLEAGVLVIGIVYLAATLIADILYTVLEPPDPIPAGRVMSDEEPVDALATPSAIKTPLEDSPALRDPAAVGFVP